MNLQELAIKLKEEIKNSLVKLDYFSHDIAIELETPKDKNNGDFSSNIAMKYARIARKSPRVVAEEVISMINQNEIFIDDIQIAGPGFINFFISKNFLTNVISEINELGDNYGN